MLVRGVEKRPAEGESWVFWKAWEPYAAAERDVLSPIGPGDAAR